MSENRTVLVTGGAGFIGSHIVEHYAERGFFVVVVDDFSRGSENNLPTISTAPVEVVNMDISAASATERLSSLFATHSPSVIFHYAAVNGTQHFYDSPERVQLVNSVGTLNLVAALNEVSHRMLSRPAVVFASTSEVYGCSPITPTDEWELASIDINAARDSYAAAKLMSEFYVKFGVNKSYADFIILRIFNVYGPRMVASKYGQVVPELITRLKRGESPLNIIGDGTQTRSFCYVDDHVKLVSRLVCQEGAMGKVINVGNPTEVSIIELAAEIQAAVGKKVALNHLPGRPNDTLKRCPNVNALLSLVGDFEFTSLEEGLIKTAKTYE